MPNIKSAIKRMRSDERKNARNQRILAELKTLTKKVREFEGEQAEFEALRTKTVSKYDSAAGKKIIPQGRADRYKSRLSKVTPKSKKS